METRDKLDRLFGLRSERFQMVVNIDREIRKLQEQKQEMTRDIDSEIRDVEAEIKDAVVETEKTVKGSYLQAVFYQGPLSFDAKRLKEALPETYKDFQSRGKSSARISEIIETL